MTITRRSLLRTTAIVPIVALAACQGVGSAVQAVPQFVTDATTIATALQALLPSLTTITGFSASTLSQIQTWVSEAKNLASELSSAASAGGSVTSMVSNFGSVVGNVISSLTGSAGASSVVQTIISAASTLLPVILSAAGIAFAQAAPASMPVAQARAILIAMAAK